jgi:hypothetical protein
MSYSYVSALLFATCTRELKYLLGCTWPYSSLFPTEVDKPSARCIIAGDVLARRDWYAQVGFPSSHLSYHADRVLGYKDHSVNEPAFFLGMALPSQA